MSFARLAVAAAAAYAVYWLWQQRKAEASTAPKSTASDPKLGGKDMRDPTIKDASMGKGTTKPASASPTDKSKVRPATPAPVGRPGGSPPPKPIGPCPRPGQTWKQRLKGNVWYWECG